MGIRVSEEEEMDGLDKSELGMEATQNLESNIKPSNPDRETPEGGAVVPSSHTFHSRQARNFGGGLQPPLFFDNRSKGLHLRNDLAVEVFTQSVLLLNCRDKIHHIEPLLLQCLQPFDDFIRLTRKTERLDNLRRDEARFFWVEITIGLLRIS